MMDSTCVSSLVKKQLRADRKDTGILVVGERRIKGAWKERQGEAGVDSPENAPLY